MGTIGLVGFFGWGNYGDELFLRLWREQLAVRHEATPVNDLFVAPYFSRPATEVAADYDAFVIGGGDLVIPNKISPLYWNSAWLTKPVYVAGVGVPTWIKNERPDVIERYQKFLRHPNVRYISVRDQESAEWLRDRVAPEVPVDVHADLVFALPLPEARRYSKPTIGVGVRHQRNGTADLSVLEDALERALADGFEVVRIVMATGDTGLRDLEVAQSLNVPGEIVHSQDLDEISSAIGGLRALLSMKFHGTVVATAYGVPSIVLSATTKSQNLYRRIDRRNLLSSMADVAMYEKLMASEPVPSEVRAELRDDALGGVRQLVGRIDEAFPATEPMAVAG